MFRGRVDHRILHSNVGRGYTLWDARRRKIDNAHHKSDAFDYSFTVLEKEKATVAVCDLKIKFNGDPDKDYISPACIGNVNKYNLIKEETIFFDDKEKNVIAANKVGIKSFVFTSIEDIKNNL